MRLLLAANSINFSILRSDDGLVDDDDWAEMVEQHLLSESEVETLKQRGGFLPLFVLDWHLHEFRSYVAEESGLADTIISQWPATEMMGYQLMQSQAFHVRGECSRMYNLKWQPIPFAYFHALKLSVLSILFVVAFWMVDLLPGAYLASISAFAMFELIMLGLLEVAVAMSDPFGDDDVDFDTKKMTNGAYKNALVLLRDPHTAKPKQPQIAKLQEAPASAGDTAKKGVFKATPVRKPTYRTPEKVLGAAPSSDLDVQPTPSVETLMAHGTADAPKAGSLSTAAAPPRTTAALLLSRNKSPQPSRGKPNKTPAVSVPQRAVKAVSPTDEETVNLLPESEQMAA